jgi:glycosyltransferase involved in cell wall biosynthesis
MQQTDFQYEVLVGEDGSSDGTREICKEYAAKNPDKIRLFLNDRKNVIYIDGRPTGRWNFINLLKNAKGKYIALLDGDDYWTDSHKLQRQVDFLEGHSELVICFHWAEWLDEESGQIMHWKYGPPVIKPYYTIDDLLEHSNFIPTCSVMFRNGLLGKFPDWYFKSEIGDFPLHIMNAQHGKIGFLDEPMAVYRRHKEGRHGGQTPSQNLGRLLDSYTLIGVNMHLDKRASYRIGVSKWNIELSRAYMSEGKVIKALLAVYDAFKIAPNNQKVPTFFRLIYTLIPNYLKGLTHESISILKHKCLKVFLA